MLTFLFKSLNILTFMSIRVARLQVLKVGLGRLSLRHQAPAVRGFFVRRPRRAYLVTKSLSSISAATLVSPGRTVT